MFSLKCDLSSPAIFLCLVQKGTCCVSYFWTGIEHGDIHNTSKHRLHLVGVVMSRKSHLNQGSSPSIRLSNNNIPHPPTDDFSMHCVNKLLTQHSTATIWTLQHRPQIFILSSQGNQSSTTHTSVCNINPKKTESSPAQWPGCFGGATWPHYDL